MQASKSRRSAFLAAFVAAVILPAAGCLDYDETLAVAADGSGTLAIDLKLDLGFIAEIKKIDPQPESEDSNDVKNFVSKKEILSDCEVPGVTVAKCDVEESGTSKTHVKLELSFKDLDALRAVRFFSDREIVVEEKGDDVSFAYRYNARSVMNMLGMGLDTGDGEKPPEPVEPADKDKAEKEKKIRQVLEDARKAASARFLLRMSGKLTGTNGDKDGDKAARWTIDKKNPKAQAALLTKPLDMDVSVAKTDAPFWAKEVENAKKRAAEAAKPDPVKPDPAKPATPKAPAPGGKPGLGE